MSGDLPLFDRAGGADDDPLAARDYAAFRARLLASDCRRCGLAAGRTRIVVDRGNPGARAMAIGEGPGAEEDARGIAFVGRGGRLFDELLAAAGVDTNRDLLIANVVKCRPPDNRVPRAGEARTCLPYLHRQVKLVDPRVIVLLGATALTRFLPHRDKAPMRELVGRPFADPAHPGREFLAFYHPAYLLRDPRKLPEARGHAALLSKMLDRADLG